MPNERVNAVRLDTGSASKSNYSTDIKKKNPWEDIGAALVNVGTSFQQYINTGDVSVFGGKVFGGKVFSGKTGYENEATFQG